ncbi:hypothetical protein [Holophaga foetida]|uniref:hypothetical protein n=1 Tax=Holophaga foetida TaxID=35839 RepID=UPI0004799C46|nr:hypothetical protein [Holophaga foetida]
MAQAYGRARKLLGAEAYPTEIFLDPKVATPFGAFVDQTPTLPAYLGCKPADSGYDLLRLLVTEPQMKKDLQNGLYGWPGVGSAIWHQWVSEENALPAKNEIGESLSEGKTVRVVLVGSIFGGTGASGLPKLGALYAQSFKNSRFSVHAMVLTPYFMPPNVKEGQLIDGNHHPLRARDVMAALGVEGKRFSSTHFLGLPEPVTMEKYQEDRQDNPTTLVERVAAWTLWARLGREDEELNGNYVLGADPKKKFNFSDLHGAKGAAFDIELERHALSMVFLAYEYGHHFQAVKDEAGQRNLKEVCEVYGQALRAWLDDEAFPSLPSPIRNREALKGLLDRWINPAAEPHGDWLKAMSPLGDQAAGRWGIFRKSHPDMKFHEGLDKAYAALAKVQVK